MVKNMCNAFRIYIALHFAPSKLAFVSSVLLNWKLNQKPSPGDSCSSNEIKVPSGVHKVRTHPARAFFSQKQSHPWESIVLAQECLFYTATCLICTNMCLIVWDNRPTYFESLNLLACSVCVWVGGMHFDFPKECRHGGPFNIALFDVPRLYNI